MQRQLLLYERFVRCRSGLSEHPFAMQGNLQKFQLNLFSSLFLQPLFQFLQFRPHLQFLFQFELFLKHLL